MIRFAVLPLFVFCLLSISVIAQEVSPTFKAGINLSNFQSTSEVDGSGDELENFKLSTGFHVAGGVNIKVTDAFGARVELMYHQKGTEYEYNGSSFWHFYDNVDNLIINEGTRNTVLSVTNAYLELPIMGTVRLGRFEFQAV